LKTPTGSGFHYAIQTTSIPGASGGCIERVIAPAVFKQLPGKTGFDLLIYKENCQSFCGKQSPDFGSDAF
jgi:hypothetical protein